MTLYYKPVQSNMATKEGKKKWYPHLVKTGTVNITTLAQEIAARSSLTPGDVYNVIQNLFDSMRDHLLESKSVKFDELGTFTVKSHSDGNGVDSPEEVSPKQINYLSIHFTPYSKKRGGMGAIKPMLTGAKFQRYGR